MFVGKMIATKTVFLSIDLDSTLQYELWPERVQSRKPNVIFGCVTTDDDWRLD